MFNERGLPLQFNRQTIMQKVSDAEFQSLKSHGITHTISLVPKPETKRVRLLVCDSRTGMVGSVDLPYPTEPISIATSQPAKSAVETPKAADQAPAGAPAAPRSIKFHGKDGHEGKLEWNAERIFYSGDMPPQASAGALFNSLFGKGFSCDGGRLVSVADKTTPAPQPLHFRTDDNHSAEVYLDAPDGVKYSGNLTIDESAKPVFEALRRLFQCKSPQ